jgi:hypothetical protein
MKKSFFLLLTVFMFASSALVAQVSDLTIKRGTTINVDGKPDDAIWGQIAPVPITNNFNGETPSVTAFFKMYYTDEFIYLLVDVTDDVHNPAWIAESKEWWMHDIVEIYFDVNDVLKDGNGPAYTDGYMAPGHYQLAPAFVEGGYDAPYFPENVVFGSLSNQVLMAYSLKSDYKSYTIEYEFPIEAFVNDRGTALDLAALKTLPQGLGFDIVVVDNDNDGLGRKRAVWKNVGPTEPYVNMDNCGVITLSDESVSSIENVNVVEISVYPNPVQEELIINGVYDKVTLTNVAGQEIKTVDTSKQVNVSDLAPGLYIVKIYENGTLSGVAKIIKK